LKVTTSTETLISEIITIFVQDRLTRRFHTRSRKCILHLY